MSLILVTVLPIFSLLMLGYLAKRSGFLPAEFWPYLEKASYYVLLPALLVLNLSQAHIHWSETSRLISGIILIPILAGFLSFPFKAVLNLNAADYTSFFQGVVRFSTYIGLAMSAVFPAPAPTLGALVLAIMIPVVNILCVLVFALFVQKQLKLGMLFKSLATNPLLVACVLGMILNILPWKLPVIASEVLRQLAQMALPTGLLAVGAGLNLAALRGLHAPFFWSAALKLLIVPLLAWGVAIVLGLDAVSSSILIVFAALPTAPSAYILARQLGGNAELMAGMITGQTLLSLVTLPLILSFLLH
ncbi:AEC family transporter [Thiothrix eikelboomii]|uniref:AEC family transporter n=1 Tax=Thiothrix eikelboomii TaxID=92487 RepID=UPI003BB04051